MENRHQPSFVVLFVLAFLLADIRGDD